MNSMLLRWIGVLIALLNSCVYVSAQPLQQLYRVDSTHRLQADARYAILFAAIEGGDTLYYALTHKLHKKGLRTQRVKLTNGILRLDSDTLLWQITPHHNGVYIGYSASHHLKDHNRTIGFASLHYAERWHLAWQPEGHLRILTAAQQSELAPSVTAPEVATIRYVSTSKTLFPYLYRVLTTTPRQPSLSTLTEGQSLGLMSNHTQALLSVGKHTAALAMHDGTWLPTDTTMMWHASPPNEQGKFALLLHGKALVPDASSSLTWAQPDTEARVWHLVDGRVVCTHADATYVLATHFQAPNSLALCPLTAIDATIWQSVSLVGLCPPLTVRGISSTLMQVSGGYTTEAWTQIPWQNFQSFDITAMVCPDTLTILPQPGNAAQRLIIAHNVQSRWLSQWANVLMRDAQRYTPMFSITTSALVPWHYPEHIVTDPHHTWTLTYPATTDNGWHTGVIPFDCDVSQLPFRFATIVYERGECHFVPITRLKAGQAFIYQPLDHSLGQVLSLTSTSSDGWLTRTLPGALRGSSDTLRLTETDPPTYLLNATGTHFVRAAVGSMILPGRAYLRLPSSAATALVFGIDELISGIGNSAFVPTTDIYYTLQGQIAGHFSTREVAARTLPRGLYIVRGKCLLLTP
ncbi:MAG: hypothetical protein Q4A44_02740 [Bacteroidales bacterium]|nr:hypothetical protein [Bacteroidales bacterium]